MMSGLGDGAVVEIPAAKCVGQRRKRIEIPPPKVGWLESLSYSQNVLSSLKVPSR